MKSRLNIVAGAIFVLALIGLLVLNPQNIRKMQASFLGLITPFIRSGSSIDRKVKDFREGMKTLTQLEEEVKLLRAANGKLLAEKKDITELQNKIEELTNALKYRSTAPFELMPARVIARDSTTWYNTVVIDRGTKEMIEPNMAVLTESGLVGKTTTVSDHSSVVILIADEQCKVAAKIKGSREQGIVKGERASSSVMPLITLNFLSKQANLPNNAEVITSGVGGVFPPGIKIGSVRDFKVLELDAMATVVPAVDLTTLEDVFVVMEEKEKRPDEAKAAATGR